MLSEGGQGVLFPLRSRRVASKTLPAGPPEATFWKLRHSEGEKAYGTQLVTAGFLRL